MSVSAVEIEHRFKHHPPKGDAAERHERVRNECRKLATVIVELVPHGREQSLALTALEEVMMWANAGIARNISARIPD